MCSKDVFKGCVQRMCSKDVFKGCVQRMCSKDVFEGCVQIVGPFFQKAGPCIQIVGL
jgi:hypothetical protein